MKGSGGDGPAMFHPRRRVWTIRVNLNKGLPLPRATEAANLERNRHEAALDRIITRMLLAFWALWFGVKALAAFGSDHVARAGIPTMSLVLPGLWGGLVMTLVGGLFVWALMASISGDGMDDSDVVVIIKIAFAAGIAWVGGHYLLQPGNGADLSHSDGLESMILLVGSFVVALREGSWMPAGADTHRQPAAAIRTMAAGASHQAQLIRFSGRGQAPREHG
jgi:hypothetical protein